MPGKVDRQHASCTCKIDCGDDVNDNCVSASACCVEKTHYFINAVAPLGSNTVKIVYPFSILETPILIFSIFSDNVNKTYLFSDTSPPLISGRILLLQKSSLLI